MSTSNKNSSNSFDLLEQIHKDGFGDSYLDLDDDDATVAGANLGPPSLTRITFKVPGDKMAKDKPKAILLAAKEVIDCLQVEFPSVKLLPWKTEEVTPLSNCKGSLPTDPKLAETFLFFLGSLPNKTASFVYSSNMTPPLQKRILQSLVEQTLISPEYSFSIPHNLTLSNPRSLVFLLDLPLRWHPPLFLAKY